MVHSREQVFRCDFFGDSVHVYAHVRAWDATEALATFVAELERDGVGVAGEVRVEPVRGGPSARARYGPRRPPSPGSSGDGRPFPGP